MPQKTLAPILKRMLTYDVYLTKTTEEDLLNHFKKANEVYKEKWEEYGEKLKKCIDELLYEENPYCSHNWRKDNPERIYKDGCEFWISIKSEDDEVNNYKYSWLFNIRSDFKLCDSIFKWSEKEEEQEWICEFDLNTELCIENLMRGQKTLRNIDEKRWREAKQQWEEKDKDWIDLENKKKAHKDHKPKSYYINLFNMDEDAKKWYNGIIPDNEDTCYFCIEDRKREEEGKRKELEDIEKQKKMDELYLKQKQEENRKRLSDSNKVKFCCDDCDYHTTSETSYEMHLSSKEHNQVTRLKTLYCKVCNVQCRTIIEYKYHLSTNKHKKMAGEFQEPSLHCEHCNYTANTKQLLDKHLKSKKHISNINR